MLGVARHTGHVVATAVSPDGKTFASASLDGTVGVWDLETGVARHTLRGHAGSAVGGVAFSPDGGLLATAGWNHTLRLWDTATGAAVRTLEGHTRAVDAVAFSPDGTRLASVGWDGTVRLWDVASGEALRSFEQPQARRVAFSADGKRLVVTGTDPNQYLDWLVKAWDLTSGEVVLEEPGTMSPVGGPGGTLAAVTDEEGHVEVRRVGTREAQAGFKGWLAGETMALSPDGRQLASVTYEDEVHQVVLQEVATGRELKRVSAHRETINALTFTPDGRRLVTASDDNTVAVWDLETGAVLPAYAGHQGAVRCVAFAPDGTRIMSGGRDGTIRTWDTATGRSSSVKPVLQGLALSADGSRLAGTRKGRFALWDVAAEREVAPAGEPVTGLVRAAFSADGKRVVALAERYPIAVWDAASGAQLMATGDGRTFNLSGVGLSVDGRLFATLSVGGGVHLMDVTTRASLGSFADLEGWVHLRGDPAGPGGLAFSPDNRLVAAADSAWRIVLWDWTAADAVRILTGHQDHVLDVAFDPTGSRLVSASADGTVRLWDIATGKALAVLEGQRGRVNDVAFSADGRWVASGGEDGAVGVWLVWNTR
jgi:WD40 repeat protein